MKKGFTPTQFIMMAIMGIIYAFMFFIAVVATVSFFKLLEEIFQGKL